MRTLISCSLLLLTMTCATNSENVTSDFKEAAQTFTVAVDSNRNAGARVNKNWAPAARWPIQPIPKEYRQPRPSDVETLILSGNLDFSTPAENATNDLLPYLSNGRQLIMKEMGHVGDIWRVQPQATHRAVASFLDTG